MAVGGAARAVEEERVAAGEGGLAVNPALVHPAAAVALLAATEEDPAGRVRGAAAAATAARKE